MIANATNYQERQFTRPKTRIESKTLWIEDVEDGNRELNVHADVDYGWDNGVLDIVNVFLIEVEIWTGDDCDVWGASRLARSPDWSNRVVELIEGRLKDYL